MSLTPTVVEPTPNVPAPQPAQGHERPFRLSFAGVIISVIALGLAIIPPIVANRSLLDPLAERQAPAPPVEREGGLNLKLGKFAVNIGGKNPKAQPVVPPPAANDPIRWTMIAAAVTALTGLAVASLAQARERHTGLTAISCTICVAAITWQYLIAGIVLGIAVAVLLLVLYALVG